MSKSAYIFFLCFWVLTGTSRSQTNMLSGQNIVRHKNFEWKIISTQFFDIYFASADAILAQKTARYAEEALFDIQQLFDYKNKTRYSLYVYHGMTDLVQSNQFPQFLFKEGGTAPIRNNTAPIVFPGSSKKLHQTVKSTICRLLMEDFYFGGSIQGIIQNTVLLHVPDWYSEGLTAFVGEGWSFEDEMWMSSLENENLINYVLEGQGHIHHIARKSIWYYISQQYGNEKLAEIFFMTRLTRKVDEGIVHVLGITLKTLTERWREFVLGRINANQSSRDLYKEKGEWVKLPSKKDKLTGMALHPVKPWIALQIERDGLQRVDFFDLTTEKFSPSPIRGGFRTDQFHLFHEDRPLAWSPDGEFLLTTIDRKGEDMLAFYNVAAHSVEYFRFQPKLERIMEIAWSHDGQKAVCSGLSQGSIDLFTFKPGSNKFKQITHDPFDDLSPVWSFDDQSIFYASNRLSDTLWPAKMGIEMYANNTDLYKISAEGDETPLERLTETADFNEVPIYTPNSFELQYLSDEHGIINLQKENIFLKQVTKLSNLSQGIWKATRNDSLFAFTTPVKGQLQLFTGRSDDFSEEQVILNSQFREMVQKEKMKIERALLLQQKRDSIRTAKLDEELKNFNKGVTTDSTSPSNTQKLKFYVFDEDDDQNSRTKRKAIKAKSRLQEQAKVLRPDFNELELKSPSQAKSTWAADHINNAMSFDPVFRWNFLVGASFKTLDGNHRVLARYRPFLDLRSSDFSIRYERLKGRFDLFVSLDHSSRFLARNDYYLRYRSTTVKAGAILPVNRFLSAALYSYSAFLQRVDLNPLSPENLDGTDLITGFHGNLTFDRRRIVENFTRSGSIATLDAKNSISLANKQLTLTTIRFDARKYLPVMGHIVLAGRLTGGLSFGPGQQGFYLGGVDEQLFSRFANFPDFPANKALGDFYFMEFLTPVRGFQFNSRSGSKFCTSNIELRMPLSRLFSNSLNSNPGFNLEFIPFFDIGTVWRQGNPLSQRNPIETEIIDQYPLYITVQTLKSPFIMGFGGGLRTVIFGYSSRLDLAWGVEDYTLLKPRVHFSLGKNF